MKNRTFLVLVAAVLIMVALLYMQPQDPSPEDQQLILNGLADAMHDVDRVTVIGAGNTPIATLERGENYWTVVERDGYRADVGRIRRNLIALSEARVVEQKTADPALHSRLGVEDIADPNATGKKFVIGARSMSFDLIVGETGVRGSMSYVRRPDAAQSFLVSADLDPGDDTMDWLRRDLLDVGAERLHSITITHPDGEVLRIEKSAPDGADFGLVDMPEGRELRYSTILNSTTGVLAELTMDDVARDGAGTAGRDSSGDVVTRFEAFDGLVIEARIEDGAEGRRVRFSARADQALADRFAPPGAEEAGPSDRVSFDAVSEEAQRVNGELAGWTYTLPSFKSDQLVRRLDDVLNTPE
jgi:hypothetical protein